MTRVLVVDDNPELAAHLAEVVQLAGLDAALVAAESPGALLRDPARLRFDVALLDAQVPGTDGTPLWRQLARHVPAAVYLLMTSSAEGGQLDGRDAPAHVILAKPFGPDVLISALRDAVTHARRS